MTGVSWFVSPPEEILRRPEVAPLAQLRPKKQVHHGKAGPREKDGLKYASDTKTG
jgi:hypothetical protein